MIYSLPFKICPPSVATRFHRKVNPYHPTLLLYQQLIKVLLVQVTDVQKNGSIAQGLFNAYTSYVHRTSRQVVTHCGSTHRLVHRWTSEPAVDDYRILTYFISHFFISISHSCFGKRAKLEFSFLISHLVVSQP